MQPAATEPVKARTDVESFSVDITGLDTMVLATWKGLTGRGDEQAVWVNPKLTAKDGSQVWLSDLKDSFVKDAAYQVWYNHNTRREPVKINGTGYDNVIVVMANSQIIVPLDKKYTKFETELGLDARSAANGKVVYRVQGFSGKDLAEKLTEDYPKQTISFLNFGSNDMRMWLTTFDSSVEEQVANKVVALLDDKNHFQKRIENTKYEQDLRKRIVSFLDIAEDAMKIYRLQQDLAWLNPQAVEAAFTDMKNKNGFDVASNQIKLDELKQLTAKDFAPIYTEDKETIEKAERALQLKKEILLSNPELDIDKLIVGRYKIGTSARQINPKSLGTQSNNWSNQTSSPRSGFDAEIVELSNLRGDIESRRIFKPENSSALPDLTLHWDADRLMFSMIDTDNKWQVFEIGLDGEGLKKLINVPEPDLEFFDATYLPSGKLLAVANIGYNGVPCVNGNDEVGNLCLYDPETGYLRRLTFDQDANWGPVVMNNGKVMYTRWEYTDLTHYFSRFVMHMNPDGTEQKSLYGSGSYFPNSTFDVKPIPGHPSRFIGVISGHHGVVRSGRLILFDPSKDRKAEKGMVQELPFKDRDIEPIIKDRLVDGVWPQFIKPYPLDDKYFVVAAKPYSSALWGIYLVDVFDNLTCIAEFEGEGLIHPIPVKKRSTPPQIPDRVNLDSKEATVFIQDIYEGEGFTGSSSRYSKSIKSIIL
ncbi:MAG: NPCBM/NEW2 domain-containing protein [Odoribacter sp.]|nr:NPCBM/NEW2 domain-containing protein [Odoribacter sp.]